MPIKLLRKWAPDPNSVRNNKHLGCFSRHLHDPNLWHVNRRSVPGAFSVGLFAAFVPMPFQMILAAALAIPCRVNLPISVGLVWLTNPITMPPIFYGQYHLGAWLLSVPATDVEFAPTWEWLTTEMAAIWQPFLLGVALFAVGSAILGYFGAQLVWRLHVWRYLLRRRARKKA